MLYKHLAAYTTTSLAAQAEQEFDMTKEELQALLGDALKPLASQIEAQAAELKELKAGKGASLAGPIIDQVKPHVDGLNAAADAMEKAGIGTHSENGHVRHLRHMAAHLAAEAVSGRVPFVYRDHDYLPGARVEAATTEQAIAAAVEKAISPLKTELEAANTKVKDLEAKAFKNAEAPQRATISPQIMMLLAKGGVKVEDMSDGKRLTVAQVDQALDAAGVRGQKAIETKLKLRHEGLMVIGAQ